MAVCVQVLAHRPLCYIHHQLFQKNIKLLNSLGCKTYMISPTGSASITFRSNVYCANVKTKDYFKKSTIPIVTAASTTTTVNPKKYMPSSVTDEKLSSYVVIQKSNNVLVDKQRIEEIQDLIKSKQIDQGKAQGLDPFNKSTPEQVEYVASVLRKDLPNMFSKHQDYRIFHRDLIFENHIRGTRTTTLQDYIKTLALLKVTAHLKYAFVELQVLKLTTHHSEGTVKVRWRIKGLSGWKVFVNFWKYKVWNLKDSAMKDVEAWYDGFSIFHVEGDGLVHKHVLLKMQPDEDHEVHTAKPNLTAKVA